jgi:hypothetical protein
MMDCWRGKRKILVVTVAVIGEPVSVCKFPILREFTGNIVIYGHNWPFSISQTPAFAGLVERNSLDTRTGNIFCRIGRKIRLAGNGCNRTAVAHLSWNGWVRSSSTRRNAHEGGDQDESK